MQPIPYDAGNTTGWQKIPIQASDEPLVLVDGLIACDSAYGSAIRVRQSVLDRLLHAQALLPKNIELVVRDGYRSFVLQEELYVKHRKSLQGDSLVFDEKIVEQYVSRPSSDPTMPAPHATGGAVDVMLRERHSNYLQFGSDFDQMDAVSALAYLEQHVPDSEESQNRRMLYFAMTMAGFAGYAPEWWHFNAPETQMGARALGLGRASYGLSM